MLFLNMDVSSELPVLGFELACTQLLCGQGFADTGLTQLFNTVIGEIAASTTRLNATNTLNNRGPGSMISER